MSDTATPGHDSRPDRPGAAYSWGGGPFDRPLNVVIVTQDDPFYIGTFFQEFLRDVATHREAVTLHGVMVQPSLGSASRWALARRIWSLYGILGFIRTGVRYVLSRIRGSGIDEYCRAAGVPVLHFPAEQSVGRAGAERPPRENNVNGPTFHQWLAQMEIDLIVSVSASQIFGKTVLGIPRIGAVNLHNAPLPRYRGMLPNFWQMYHGENESVLTIHEMVPELDAGDILLQTRTPITAEMSLEELMTLTKRNSAGALWRFLRDLHQGTVTATPMSGAGSYFTWPTRSEAREFRRRGHQVW